MISNFSCFLGFSLGYKDEAVEDLLSLKDQLDNPDHTVLYKTCSDLTKVHVGITTVLNCNMINTVVSLPSRCLTFLFWLASTNLCNNSLSACLYSAHDK